MLSKPQHPHNPVTGATAPKVGLLNPAFVYVPSAVTDIRKTFELARAAQAAK